MNFREELKSKTAAVEKIVESYLPEESGTQHEWSRSWQLWR